MDDTQIISVITTLRKSSSSHGDGGRTFTEEFARKIRNTIDEDKNAVIDFLLREIKYNTYALRSIAIPVLSELKDESIAPSIYEILNEVSDKIDDQTEKNIVETLFILRYKEPKWFYQEYLANYSKKVEQSGDESPLFFFLILYLNVDPENALKMLSSYLVKHILSGDKQMESFFTNWMGYLFLRFSENSEIYLPKLICEVYAKNKISGDQLRKIMLNYLHSDLAQVSYGSKFVNKKIELINGMNG